MNRSVNRNPIGAILALALAEALIGALALALGGSAARVAAALPLVLLLPGLALTFAAFPRRALGPAERLLLGLGLSLAVAALGGLALNLTPWGLRIGSWATLLGGVTVVATAIGLARRRVRQPGWAAAAPARRGGGMTLPQATLLALAALVLSGSLAITVRGAQEQETVGFTQLWMVPDQAGNPATVRIGVSNREPATTPFRLQLVVEGDPRRTWTLRLANDETWEQAVDLPADLAPTDDVEAVLYRGDAPDQVYRRVKLGREP